MVIPLGIFYYNSKIILGGNFMSIIKVKNISKRFNDKLVLDNISYEVKEGEIFGFIGPNGAGKSTLINIMTSLLTPDNGTIEICAYDNLEFFGALYGLRGKLLKERIAEALKVTGLEETRKQKVKKFSGGMKRRLNIAVSILHHPKVLILDEPTVGVDPQSRNHIFSFIKNICKEWGTTVIYTSHYMEEIEELCKRVFIIDLGKEVSYGDREEIKASVFSNNKVIIETQDISGETIMKLKDVEGIDKVSDKDNILTLTIDSKFKLASVLSLLEKESINIKKISYEEAKLEDVFLSLTGKTLRD